MGGGGPSSSGCWHCRAAQGEGTILGPREESHMSRAAQLEPQLDLHLSPGLQQLLNDHRCGPTLRSTLKGKELET